ncbi:protein TIME FOR COFFEE-like isoform X2 [Phalaenopsis equestris]|uniref:protein TIME FOR COFFEE-like isoform X2 n=1 Tax=Phalaenopsis equestris TaxID=78828 RepID=UPI0009E3A3B8|nr:protein TIME FOR COFFEE-like isoform X2 [Phalaenopsis equestris]
MDRIRDGRRGSMAAVNGSLSRRRQRSSSLRDSPEEDGAMEMQETSRLRERGGKKDRDRDRSGRNKRRRGERMMHGSHREEGEDSSEESVDEDDEDEEEDSSVAVRLQPPQAQNPAPASSGMQSHNIRKGYPVKPVRPPGTCTWKVAEEMIGAPIPRKARSSSVKRSQECWVSGGGGSCGGGGDQVPCQASISPARRSPSSTAPLSPSSSNASIRKRMKPITVPKPRLPKTSKSSSIQEIEIEVAEVLFGMTRQVPSKQEDHRHDPKESNGSGNEVKSRVSSPNPISPPATSQPSTMRPSNPSINSFPLTATAPKRKRPRTRIEDESPTSPPSSTALPTTSSSSAAKLDTEVLLPPVGTKTDSASPRSEKNASPAVENGCFSSDQAVSNAPSAIVFSAKVNQDSVKAESIPDLKDTDSRSEKKAKEEASTQKDSPAANLDANIEETPASKASMISDAQREEKFSIDLMAPPGKLSPEIESNSDYVGECKPVETENAPKPEFSKAEGEEIEKKSKSEAEELAHDDKNGGKPSTDDSDSRKPAGKERKLDLQLDLEKLDKDVAGAIKHQGQKQQSKASRTEPKTEKAGSTASMPMPMQITGWAGGFPPFGFMGQVPPIPPVVPVDGTSGSSKLSFHPSQLRPKRCAAHCYIAQNIYYHQQITRLNPFWPSAAGAAPLFASKQYNLNTAPPSDSAILRSPLQGSFSGKSLGPVQEKCLPASAAKDKSNVATQFMDVSQRKPPVLPQPSQPGSAGNMLAPAFIFPLNQQQAAAAGAAAGAGAAAAANRSVVAKLTPGSGNTAQSSGSAGYAAVGASGANGSGTSMSFNYPAHVGGAQPCRGASPAQAMPFFNLSFYPSQMLHPSQLRLQQQPPSSQQPPPYPQQGHQNPSTSSGSSSSQKNTQQSQRVPAAAPSAITAGNSHGFPPSNKQQHISHSHQVRQLEPEPGGEDAPSTADSRVSQTHKNIYAQKFAMPAHSQNFALIAPAAALSSGVGNHSEKHQQQQSQNQVMKVDLTPSQAFAMSFATYGGAAAASAAAAGAPHGLDFSSMAQNHAIFQSLPETVRHGYQVSAAAAAAHSSHQQQQQQNKKPEDGKSPNDMGNASTVSEDGKISGTKVLGNAQQHSHTFSRADTDSPISSILTNTVIDSSSRTLNLIQPPPSAPPRISSRPASAAPATSNSLTNSSNSQHLLSQQHQQQVLQLPKQVQQLQLQQQLQQHQQRAKSASSHSSASLYTDRLSGNSTPSKFPQPLAGFPPTLIQNSASSQPTQWKASTRAVNPSSAAGLASATPSSSTSVKTQIPQVRSQQPSPHQTHQISFGVSPAKVPGQSSQHLATPGNSTTASLSSPATIAVGSPQNSVSKSSSGSPHSSAIAKSVPPSPVIPVLPFQKQQPGKNSSSSSTISPLPVTNRNLPSILGNPHMTSPQNLGSKAQTSSQHFQQSQMPKQHSPQAQTAQLFFSYPYMQSQTSHSDAAAAAAAARLPPAATSSSTIAAHLTSNGRIQLLLPRGCSPLGLLHYHLLLRQIHPREREREEEEQPPPTPTQRI